MLTMLSLTTLVGTFLPWYLAQSMSTTKPAWLTDMRVLKADPDVGVTSKLVLSPVVVLLYFLTSCHNKLELSISSEAQVTFRAIFQLISVVLFP